MRLEIRNLKKSYKTKDVLKDISFTVESGFPMAYLGRNGAGKTTSIRAIMGVIYKDGGEVLLDGQKFEPKKIKIGYLPEERGMYQKVAILDQLVYFGELKGYGKSASTKSALELLEKVELLDYKNKKLETLSKGNQQKIQLVQTLLGDPDFIIMDEPFSGLDPVNANILKNLVLEAKANNKLMLFSSHQMGYVDEICSELTILNDGEIAISGNIDEIRRKHSQNKYYIVPKSDLREIIKSQLIQNGRAFTEEGGKLVFELNNINEKQELVTKHLDDLDEFGAYKSSLGDIFIHYTR